MEEGSNALDAARPLVLRSSMLDRLPIDKQHIVLDKKSIIAIERDTFHRFLNIRTINLSNNLIEDLDPELFSVHAALETINFSHNSLRALTKDLLIHSSSQLRSIDFGYNQISQIDENCLFSFSLIDLNLSHNEIKTVHPEAFFYLPDLKYLNLSNNKLTELKFSFSRLVRFAAGHNRLQTIDLSSCCIEQITLENNRFGSIENVSIVNSETLNELNLENDESSGVDEIFANTFDHLKSLKILRINVKNRIDLVCVTPLENLRWFSLVYRGRTSLEQNSKKITEFFARTLETLHLSVVRFEPTYFDHMDLLVNLKNIRFKCLDPNFGNDSKTIVHIVDIFAHNQHLAQIELANLNWFLVPKRPKRESFDYRRFPSLTKMTYIGLKNQTIDNYFTLFPFLVSLNVSFGSIVKFERAPFASLRLLKFLYLESLRLVGIRQTLTKHNVQLEILSFANNRITTIERYSFSHLTKLKHLILNGNPLKIREINHKTFYGLREFGTLISTDFGNPLVP